MRRSASDTIKNLEQRIARLENKSAGWNNDEAFVARVVAVETMDHDDFKQPVRGVSDLQKIFDYCEDRMRDQIINTGKFPSDLDLSWIGDGDIFVIQCLLSYEGEGSGTFRGAGNMAYQIEMKSAGIASLIMKNPSFFKNIRSNE